MEYLSTDVDDSSRSEAPNHVHRFPHRFPDQIHQRSIVRGFACGLVAGVALALLFAPASGRDTRGWITTHGRDARRRTGQILRADKVAAIIRKSGILGIADVLRSRTGPLESHSTAPGH